jgi:hypothetical protein
MATDFTHDVFLSHSPKNKAVVRPLAERLRQDGLKVWFDEWVLKPEVPLAHRMGEGSGVRAAKIEEGLEHAKFGFRISDLRSPACRPMRSARTGRRCACRTLNSQLSTLNPPAPR